VWTFAVGPELMPFIIAKGSVAVDGVSLTVARVEGDAFSVALIPTTLERTTLGGLRVGDAVNIETDILARTVVAALQRMRGDAGSEPLSVNILREQGW
jgi:riboflavin synthase